MKFLIADDHANVRRGLREILVDAFAGSRVAEASNGNEVLILLRVYIPDILLLDINMPGRSGMQTLMDVKAAYPHLPVIMVSVQPASQYASPCIAAGAAAYINKSDAPETLPTAIRQILGGITRASIARAA